MNNSVQVQKKAETQKEELYFLHKILEDRESVQQSRVWSSLSPCAGVGRWKNQQIWLVHQKATHQDKIVPPSTTDIWVRLFFAVGNCPLHCIVYKRLLLLPSICQYQAFLNSDCPPCRKTKNISKQCIRSKAEGRVTGVWRRWRSTSSFSVIKNEGKWSQMVSVKEREISFSSPLRGSSG